MAMKTIDMTYLRDLSNGSDRFIKKMLTMLLRQTPEGVDALEKHYINKDWESLRFTAHKLQASFIFMGIQNLPETIHEVEEYAANKNHLDLLPGLIFSIKQVWKKAMKELQMELKSLR
jgi:HPt (histidine-containing phosphotransfer) domain-containing protein